MSPSVYIGFGSNLGDRYGTFREAVRLLGRLPHTEVRKCSRMYETDPVGLTDEGSEFFNAVIHLETGLGALELFAATRWIELTLGKPSTHCSDHSRLIDLDLLLYDEERICRDGLEIPHPRMHGRGFVLVPLAEIAPQAWHPVIECSVATLLGRLSADELHGIVPLEGSVEAAE